MTGNIDVLSGSSHDKSPEFQQLESRKGELHLRFYVPSESEFALPAIGIREVISASPDMITSIPNASSLLLGTLNWRGQVIWIADLGQFLGVDLLLNTDRPEIPVIAVEDQDTIIGLAVDRIVGMDWLEIEQIQPAKNVPDSMAPFLRGEWLSNDEKNPYLRLLDQISILRSARWAA
ncbi:MAG: chemotaxis protein CheW [Chamaesiphon sp.]